MNRPRILIALFAALLAALLLGGLLSACSGGGEQEPPTASEARQSTQPAEEARVQIIRGRATLGNRDAPILIQDYSDFL